VIEIHKKFSIPAACLVFALLAVGLGVTNRKDGKLASFVLGLAVIFAYYVIMFGAEAMAKGALIPAWTAMWIPNVVLGGLGIGLLLARARGVDYAVRFNLPQLGWPFRPVPEDPAPGDRMRLDPPPGAGSRPQRGTVVVIRIPQFQLPRPQLLDLYVARTYGRMLLMCIVGIMGLFYISTFLDKSDKLFKGEVTFAMLMEYLWWETPQFLYYIIAIAVLLSAIITVGLLTKNSELIVMRACGISLYRTALPLIVFAAIASGVLFAFEERVLAFSNRRADYLNHIIKGRRPADLRCRQSQVAGRLQRRDLSLPLLRSPTTGAQPAVGVPIPSRDARAAGARPRHPGGLCAPRRGRCGTLARQGRLGAGARRRGGDAVHPVRDHAAGD
jgi:hypothetical protein